MALNAVMKTFRNFDAVKLDREKAVQATAKTWADALIKNFFFADKLISTENHESRLESLFDYSGVDMLAVSSKLGVVPLSIKVDYKAHKNFVVRKCRSNGEPTDFAKLTAAQKHGAIRPLWHVKINILSDVDALVVACRTDDLVDFIRAGYADIKSHDNGEFYVCGWNALRYYGVKVFTLNDYFSRAD